MRIARSIFSLLPHTFRYREERAAKRGSAKSTPQRVAYPDMDAARIHIR